MDAAVATRAAAHCVPRTVPPAVPLALADMAAAALHAAEAGVDGDAVDRWDAVCAGLHALQWVGFADLPPPHAAAPPVSWMHDLLLSVCRARAAVWAHTAATSPAGAAAAAVRRPGSGADAADEEEEDEVATALSHAVLRTGCAWVRRVVLPWLAAVVVPPGDRVRLAAALAADRSWRAQGGGSIPAVLAATASFTPVCDSAVGLDCGAAEVAALGVVVAPGGGGGGTPILPRCDVAAATWLAAAHDATCRAVEDMVLRCRCEQAFDAIRDFPASIPALLDVRYAIAARASHARPRFVAALQAALAARLLHDGAATRVILDVLLAAVKACGVADPSHLVTAPVAATIAAYLRGRSDTVPTIVAAMTQDEDCELYSELMSQGVGGGGGGGDDGGGIGSGGGGGGAAGGAGGAGGDGSSSAAAVTNSALLRLLGARSGAGMPGGAGGGSDGGLMLTPDDAYDSELDELLTRGTVGGRPAADAATVEATAAAEAAAAGGGDDDNAASDDDGDGKGDDSWMGTTGLRGARAVARALRAIAARWATRAGHVPPHALASAAGVSAALTPPRDGVWAPAGAHTDGVALLPGGGRALIPLMISIVGSQEPFVGEYRNVLSAALLALPAGGWATDDHDRMLELMRVRFGDDALAGADTMLRDVVDSRRLSKEVTARLRGAAAAGTESETSVEALIVSTHYWPPLPKERDPPVLHPALAALQAGFAAQYATLRKPRHLVPTSLGTVTLEVGVAGGPPTEVQANLLQASLLLHVRDAGPRGAVLRDLTAAMRLPPPAALAAAQHWVALGVLSATLLPGGSGGALDMVLAPADAAGSGAADGTEGADGDGVGTGTGGGGGGGGGGGAAAVMAALLSDGGGGAGGGGGGGDGGDPPEAVATWQSYVMGMLTNLGPLPLDRIHNSLKLFASMGDYPYDKSAGELSKLLSAMVKEERIQLVDGVYALL